MSNSPESQPRANTSEAVSEHPETVAIPECIERSGVRQTPVNFTASVQDDSGRQLINAPQAQNITIQIPANQTQLETWAKGSSENSLTWYGLFWLRLIKKAILYGWNVVIRKQ